MASTFHVFRKNQRVLLAVFGVLLMIAFTLGGVLPEMLSDGSSADNPLIATSRFGYLYRYDVGTLIDQRNVVKQFLTQAIVQVRMQEQLLSIQQQFRVDIQKLMNSQLLQSLQEEIGQRVIFELAQLIGPSSERAVVEMRLQAGLGEREGIVISDEAITEYLQTLTNDRVTNEQMKFYLSQIRMRDRRQHVSKAYLYDALRNELAASKYRQIFLLGMQTTPAERWDYFTRSERRANVELVALSASEMLSEVPDPSDRDLRTFFNEHKEDEPMPGSPTPGFKVPHQAAFEYFRADYDKFFDETVITDKEIEEHYEKNKDQLYLYSSIREDASDEPAVDEPNEKQPSADKPAEKPANKPAEQSSEKNGEKSTPKNVDKPSDQPTTAKPDDGKPTVPVQDEPKPAELKSSEPKAEPKEENKSDDSSCQERRQMPSLRNLLPNRPRRPRLPPLKNRTLIQSRRTNRRPMTPKLRQPPQVAVKPQPAIRSRPLKRVRLTWKGPANMPQATTPRMPPAPQPPLSDRFQLPTDIKAGGTPKYEPLWHAKDKIRKELAGARAVAKMDGVLQKLQTELRQYSRKRAEEEHKQKDNDAKTELPTPPEFASLAEAAGVSYGTIPLSSAYQVSREPGLGQSMVGSDRFVDFAFRSLKIYASIPAQDTEGNRYVFWKTKDEPAHVPDLANTEVRKKVEHAWKIIQARDLVHRKAGSLATEARLAGKPLKEVLGAKGYTVSETDAFSWLTTGTAGNFNQNVEPQISEVDGVIDPGPDFMRTVFDLQVGEVGVAINNPETVAYVVRVTNLEPSETMLHDTFMAEKGGTSAQLAQASQADQRQLVKTWHEQFIKDARLVWVRPPEDGEGIE